MSEVFGYLIGLIAGLYLMILFIVYVVLPIVTMIILISGGGIGAAAAGHGVWIGGKSFTLTFRQAIKQAQRNPKTNFIAKFIMRLYGSEPAFLLPIYDMVWYAMKYLCTEIWPEVDRSARGWFTKAGNWWTDAQYKDWFSKIAIGSAAVGAIIGGLVHYLVTFALVTLSILLLLALITISVFIASVLMIFFETVNRIYGWYYQISYICPTCHKPMTIPVHICDKCSAEHKLLWPSVYGIVSHRCSGTSSRPVCNNKLATFGKERDKLSKRCPHCTTPVEGLGGTNVHIPIVGGRGVGKSFYITMAMMSLMEEAPSKDLTVTLPDINHDREYREKVRMLKAGNQLKANIKDNDSATAFNVQIKKKQQKVPKLLYIYDAAGEYWAKEEDAQRQKYFEYVHGVLFIIDPFSIEKVNTKYESQLSSTPGIINKSEESLDIAYENMLVAFETLSNLKRNLKFHQPIAVVVTKCDAFDLDDSIGGVAAVNYMRDHPEITSEREAIHKLVEDFLNEYSGNFLRNLKNQFANVKFFSCSSVGVNNDPSINGFKGSRVLDPLLWLMEQNQVLSGSPPILAKILNRR